MELARKWANSISAIQLQPLHGVTMPQFHVKASVNYPETDGVETPDFTARSDGELLQWIMKLLTSELDATSFTITIVPRKA
jgi:hypothetical protein